MSLKLTSNVIGKDQTTKIIRETLNDLAEIVGNSLGPNGYNTILEGIMENHTISKDGYTIFGKIKYDNEISTTILEIIKKISKNLVREVGDGSTSCIVIANALYNKLEKIISESGISPKIIMDILGSIESAVTNKILAHATPITESNFYMLEKIAGIANNNDSKLGELVTEVYHKIGVDGFIILEKNKTGNEDRYEITDGYELDRGYVSNIFLDSKNTQEWKKESSYIFISNDDLTEEDLPYITELLGFSLRTNTPLVIIAKGYSYDVINCFKVNKVNNKSKLQICAIDYAITQDVHRDILEDFAVYMGATIYNKYENEQPKTFSVDILGYCHKVNINEKSSMFTEGNINETTFNERVEFLEETLNKTKSSKFNDNDELIFQIERRISKLKCNSSTIYVGGNSEMEKDTRLFLIEDSIYACKSALKNGYVVGGNLFIPALLYADKSILSHIKRIYDSKYHTLIEDILNGVEKSFLSSFVKVMSNKNKLKTSEELYEFAYSNCIEDRDIFNVVTEEFEPFNKTGIINSCNTDIEIMKSTFSIIGLLVTSNQFICKSTIDTRVLDNA